MSKSCLRFTLEENQNLSAYFFYTLSEHRRSNYEGIFCLTYIDCLVYKFLNYKLLIYAILFGSIFE